MARSMTVISSWSWRGIMKLKTSHYLLVTVILIMGCSPCQAIKKKCSTYEEYTVDYGNGTIACEKCPYCWKGTGLVYECGHEAMLRANDTRTCVPCPNGTHNSIIFARVVCQACNEHKHRKITRNCTSTHDREYGKCFKGFYLLKQEGRCESCSCCTQGNNQVIQECKDHGLPANMQCRKVPGQECPVYTTPSAITTETTPGATPTSAVPLGQKSTEARPGKIAREVLDHDQRPSFNLNLLIPLTSIAVIGVVAVSFMAYRRSSGDQPGLHMIELGVMNGMGGQTSVADTATVPPEEQPLMIDQPCPMEVESEDLQKYPDCLLSEMPSLLRVGLCIELDLKQHGKARVHRVAREFDLSQNQLNCLEIADQNVNDSPTRNLLTALQSKGIKEPTVRDLVKKLICLGYKDIVDKLDWTAGEPEEPCVVETCDALEQVKKSAKIKTETGKNELEENAQQKCFQLRLDIPGEGNCMFHALLDQLARFGIERIIEPQLLRKKLVDFLQENSNLNDGTPLFHFVDDQSTWSDYLAKMRQHGTWGDHLVLLAAANVYQRPIIVITSLPNKREMVIKPTQVGQTTAEPMVIGHVAGSHFVSLEPRPDLLLSEMSLNLREYFQRELDIVKPRQTNWHDVAKGFRLSLDQLKELQIEEQKPKGSPTEALFSALETQGKSVNDLVKILVKIGRADIVNNWDWVANQRKKK